MGQLEPTEGLTSDMVKLFRRPSIAPDEIRRKTQSTLEAQLSGSSSRRISTQSSNKEQKRETESGSLKPILKLQSDRWF